MSKIDPLEELMRSRLLDDKPADSSWNVPPDSVFEDAMKAIDAEKNDRRKPFFIIFLASILIIAIGLLTYRLNQRITHLNTEFNELKSQAIGTEENIQNQQTKSITSGSISNEGTSQNTSNTEEVSTLQTKSTNNTSTKNIRYKNNSNISTYNSSSLFINPPSSKILEDNVKQKNNLFAGNTSIIEKEKKNVSPIEKSLNRLNLVINKLATKQFLILSDHKIIDLPEEMSSLLHPIKKLAKERDNSPISLFGFAGANFSSIHMTNMSDSKFSLTGYEEYCLGYQFGFGAEYQLKSRWSLNGNLSYTVAKNRSVYESDYKYDQNNEYTNNVGEVIYQDDIIIESPMHAMTENVSFKNSSSGPVHEEMMQTKVAFDQILHFANLNLGIDYTIHESDKTRISAGLGLRGQYLLSMKEDMDMQMYHDSHMMMEKTASHNSLENMNRALLAPYGKIGFDYKLNDRNSIKLTGNYYHPLTSIRQTDSEVDPSTYLKNIEFSVLFKHRIN